MAKKSKWNIKHPDAIKMHQDFYEKDFEVIKFEKCGSFSYGLWEVFDGATPNAWEGLVSTDGDKVVFTKGGYFKEGKITKSWELSKTDIVDIKHGTFKTQINFKDKHKGLTTASLFEILMLMGGMLWLLFYKSKRVVIRPENSFDNLEKFNALLAK